MTAQNAFSLLQMLHRGSKLSYADIMSELEISKRQAVRLINEASRFFPVTEEIIDRKRYFWMMAS